MRKLRILQNKNEVAIKTGMTTPNKAIFIPLIIASITHAPGSAFAAGSSLYEQATPDVGTASAGRYAHAQNAGTVLTNPAGMTNLEGKQLLISYQLFAPTFKLDVKKSTYDGGDGGNAALTEHIPAFYYTHSISDDLKLGIGIGSYFGGSIDYNSDWTGRYHVQSDKMYTQVFSPGIAYRVNEWLSVGGTLNYLSAELDLKRAVIGNDFIAPEEEDGEIHFDGSDTGYSATVSALFEVSNKTNLGISYMSETELIFSDIPFVTNQTDFIQLISVLYNFDSLDTDGLTYIAGALESELNITVTIPQQLMFSVYHELSDDFALMGNVGWQNYSRFGNLKFNAPELETKLIDKRNFKDTWHFALGSQWQYNPKWRLSAGIAYDTSPVDTKFRLPEMPFDRQIRLAAGAEYAWQKHIDLGMAYSYVDFGNAEIQQEDKRLKGALFGDYSNNYMHVLSFNLSYKF